LPCDLCKVVDNKQLLKYSTKSVFDPYIRMKMKSLISLIVIILFSTCGISQVDKATSRVKLSGFPVAYYTPESGLGFGVLGLMNFNWTNDSINARKSSMTLGAAYTLRNQTLFYLPFNLFVKNDKYRLNGELGYYDYIYFFFGKGVVSGSFENKQETFEVSFPRIRLNALKKVQTNLFVGFRFAFDYYYGLKLSDDSWVNKQKLLGQNAGVNCGLGPAFLYDTRDNIFYPRKGIMLDVNSSIDLGHLISDYKFFKFITDFSAFRSLTKKTVVGLNINYQQNSGHVPFYQLSMIGGPRRLRGQFEGEFRDNLALQGQLEIRQEFLKNWGAVVFLGVGKVADKWNNINFSNFHPGYGVGLRYKLNKADHVNIRLDLGYGEGKLWPYFTINEAF
jgi:outer membrane protein assembly factor BamA